MKERIIITILFILSILTVDAQVSGFVRDENSMPLHGATLTLKKSGISVKTDKKGYFSFIDGGLPDSLSVSFMGYNTQRMAVTSANSNLAIILQKSSHTIEEVQVVNTGFYSIPKERATGSFTVVDNKLLNRSVGGNILQRLDGIAPGVQFVTPNGTKTSDIRVRGLATIQSDASPLIVVDNFPYDGDISSINPNDIDNITILKDGAAASIWGARAGNGVIVITTKKGQYGQKGLISINSNLTISQKPDLMYSQKRLPSEVIMEIEKEKYQQGSIYKQNAQQVPFPRYVEMLMALEKGTLTREEFNRQEFLMKNTEVREEAMKYLYQPTIYQQYAMGARGGGDHFTYYLSGGYDRSRGDLIGKKDDRINLNLQNTFRPFSSLELSASMWYSKQNGQNNSISLDDLKANATQVGLSPYISLKDENNEPASVIRDYRAVYVDAAENSGLLDWQYSPLQERELIDRRTSGQEIRTNLGLRYNFLKYFDLNATYQYLKGNNGSTVQYDRESYYVRNLVNPFTQTSGVQAIPYGGIFQDLSPSDLRSHSGRLQLNYMQDIGRDHRIAALAGAEIRESVENIAPGYTLFGYDPQLLIGTNLLDYTENYVVRPSGRARIPYYSYQKQRLTDRYLSYFGNASYTYRGRYILSGSMRWDGSNLFGVKANQKGTPLWSIGASWEMSKEDWFRSPVLNYLRLRSTYGRAGNVNKNVSALPTIQYLGYSELDPNTPLVLVKSIGNPSLRWEQVNTLNFGMDFRLWDRISGNIDYYIKNASDLVGADILPPSTGVSVGSSAQSSNLINYADLQTRGLDLQLATQNLKGDFGWESSLLVNLVRNRITGYRTNPLVSIFDYINGKAPVEGRSRDAVYGIPWFGLSHENGYPLVRNTNGYDQDYAGYLNRLKLDDLKMKGVSVPPFYGSLRNMFSYKGVTLDVMLSWKSGYVFKRSSSNGIVYSMNYHMDYLKRWQKPGDELLTDVPAVRDIDNVTPSSGTIYDSSEILIEKGDHIRLQDISLSYTLPKSTTPGNAIKNMRFYAYARNLGVIWKSNRHGIDPDYVNSEFVAPRTFALGLQVDF
ncbi:SusC/RagA family TonB-linked outer membrane protein [Sphingobacterium multivorum]|uniref:SusC/RagA family TonB-linked outer membrane protein n=1 Tax=Sphingobacterium multivorum TaxID=28454 RepID=UPI0028A77FC2|nr:SusC/RagA family TonB-linked outer membrane protein [Sphingobacterium multivorum]